MTQPKVVVTFNGTFLEVPGASPIRMDNFGSGELVITVGTDGLVVISSRKPRESGVQQ